MVEKKHNKAALKWVGIVLAVAVTFVALATVYMNMRFKQLMEAHLQELVRDASDGRYDVKFSEVNTNVLTHRAVLSEVKVFRDSTYYQAGNKAQDKADINYEISIRSVTLEGFHPLTLLKQKKLNITELLFQQARVHLFNEQLDFNISISEGNMEGLNIPLYLREQELNVKQVHLSNTALEVVNNAIFAKRDTTSRRYLPHQLLYQLNKKISIQELRLDNVDVSYAEQSAKTKQTGKITFSQTTGVIKNITNVMPEAGQSRFIRADLSTYLMGQGKLDVRFRFDRQARDGAFSYEGRLAEMDGRALNQITAPLGMLEIKKGKIKGMEFQVQANERRALGEMKLSFNDLSIKLLKQEQDRLVKNGLMSFLANAVVIRPNNPDSSGVFITAPIRYERIPSASFFKFTWKALFSGIKYSIGITPKKEREVKAAIASFNEKKVARKRRRADRQAE